MKQVSFLVEVVLTDNKPTIIIRDPRGSIVKITDSSNDVDTFLSEVLTKLKEVPVSNPS